MPTPTETLATLGPRAALTSAHHANLIVNSLMDSSEMADWINATTSNFIGGGIYYELLLDPSNRHLTRTCSPNPVQPINGTVIVDKYFNMSSEPVEPYDDDYDLTYDYLREKITNILLDERNY